MNKETEYELIKNYIQERFGYEREEVFEWMKATGVKSMEEFFRCKEMPGYHKKEVRKVLTNLSLLEQLYQR